LTNKHSPSRNSLHRFREALNLLFVPANDPKYIIILLGGITLVGLVLRLYRINDPIGYDEAYTFINFSSKPFKFILADYHAPNNHILNSLLIGIVYRILGNHYWIVRLPALIAGVLGIPTSHIAARRFFTAQQSLAAAAVLAITPTIIAESANGRGYTLVILFSLLLANFAGILVRKQRLSALLAYAVTGALGFYSIPIFLYPMAGISLWVACTYLFDGKTGQNKWTNLRNFLIACAASGILTFVLYSPVIIFGTGLKSLVANDMVVPQTWNEFIQNLVVRTSTTWNSWTINDSPALFYLGNSAFLVSVLLYRKVSNQKLPMQVFLALGAGIMVLLQRVAPLPRIWGYLEMFFLFYSAAGLVWLLQSIVNRIFARETSAKLVSSVILVAVLAVFTSVTIKTQSPSARADRTIAPEQLAAEYIAGHITNNDTIIAPAPVDLQTAYYLKILGVPYETYQQRGVPMEKGNALVILRSRGDGKIKTLDDLLKAFKLENALNIEAGKVVFEYGPLQVTSIPAR
jgi:uncharacterized membrane protein